MKQVLDSIFERELKRLDEASQKESLDLDDLRRLDILTRALKQYQEPTKEAESPLSQLSSDELIAFIRREDKDVEVNPQPPAPIARDKASRKKGSKRGTVEKG